MIRKDIFVRIVAQLYFGTFQRCQKKLASLGGVLLKHRWVSQRILLIVTKSVSGLAYQMAVKYKHNKARHNVAAEKRGHGLATLRFARPCLRRYVNQ